MVRLTVRRFICGAADCPRRTFAESFSRLAAPYERFTTRLNRALERVGLALAGRAGARLAAQLGFGAGRMTLLRRVMALPDPRFSSPRVLGADDFAIRRGQTYSTVLTSVEGHCVVDVLPTREAGPLAAWLSPASAVTAPRCGHYATTPQHAQHGYFVQYYLLAGDVFRLARLHWVMETSMLMTLANKHRSTVSTMARKYAATIETPHGPRKCFEARVERTDRKPLVGRFGGIPLARDKKTVINDRRLAPANTKREELVTRLLAGRCEPCGRIEVEVHHVAKLADLGRSGTRPPWADLMAARHRKALVVCGSCHADIHGKKPVPALTE